MKLAAILLGCALSAPAATWYVTIAGLGGEPDYEQRFSMEAADIATILKSAGGDAKVETLSGPSATKAAVRASLEKIAREATAQDALVVMLIGHGTWDGVDYKMNLPGPDLTGSELAGLLDRIPAARQLVVDMTSSSGAAIGALRKPNRVVIAATKSGMERNATVFARFWVEALRDPAADADKNQTVSALEAFRYADQRTVQYYETGKRLATEHAVLEDTGRGDGVRAPSPENGEGLRASAFPLIRLGSATAAAGTPEKRKLIEKKESLEQQIDQLKYQKASLDPEEYRKELTALLLDLAKTQEELEK